MSFFARGEERCWVVLDEELCGGEHEDDDDDNPLDHSSNSGFSKPVFKRFMARQSMFPFLPASCDAINNGFVSMFLSMFLSMFPAMFPSTFLSMLLSMPLLLRVVVRGGS